MAILPILRYPNPQLREMGVPVSKVDDAIRTLVDDMAETMYDAPGVGIAAPQIGKLLRIFIIDIAGDDEPSDLKVFINPEITSLAGSLRWDEGCLSFPGATESIKRAESVTVRATGLDGKQFELEAVGLLAVAIQHENDHLDGVLMIDKLNPLGKRRLSRKVAKESG
ncbi:MAG: peptide deformylase [Polyangiaceae bacterium]|nr:peptide deformylase [Polyangiaceae bacterium]